MCDLEHEPKFEEVLAFLFVFEDLYELLLDLLLKLVSVVLQYYQVVTLLVIQLLSLIGVFSSLTHLVKVVFFLRLSSSFDKVLIYEVFVYVLPLLKFFLLPSLDQLAQLV